jgi:hypothetical protein
MRLPFLKRYTKNKERDEPDGGDGQKSNRKKSIAQLK